MIPIIQVSADTAYLAYFCWKLKLDFDYLSGE